MKEGEHLKLIGKKVGVVLTGSFSAFKIVIEQMKNIIKEGASIVPIMSYSAYMTDTKYGEASMFVSQIEDITQNKMVNTIQESELIGLKHMTDIMIVAPASRKYHCKTSNGNYGYSCY